MIQEHTLATLPGSLNSSVAHYFATDVYSSEGSERKKRSELAIAIDGYGTNIYDVFRWMLILVALLINDIRFVPRNL